MLKLRIFYGRMKKRPFKGLFRKVLKNRNLSAGTTPLFLEGRLDTLLYRTNLFTSIFFLKHFIHNKHIFVNGLCITEAKYLVKVGDVIFIAPLIYSTLHNEFLQRLKTNTILLCVMMFPYCLWTTGPI